MVVITVGQMSPQALQTMQKTEPARRKLTYPQPPEGTKPVEEPPTPVSRQEMLRRAALSWVRDVRQSAVTLSQLHQQRSKIEPAAEYVMQEAGPAWSKGQIFTGEQIKKQYDLSIKVYGKTALAYQKDQQARLKALRLYPKGTTFTPVQDGYQVTIPEREQLRFSETALSQIEKQPPVIRDVQLFSFYMGSSFAALGKGVAEFLGVGKPYDIAMAWQFSGGAFGRKKEFGELLGTQKYGVRYTTWGAYLPGGIKGETKILERHPVHAAAGGITAEAIQWWSAGKILTLGASKVVIPAFSKGVSSLPKLSMKFTRAFPLAPYSGRFLGKISGTTIGKQVGLFARGYRPAWVMAGGTTKVVQTTKTIGEKITQKTVQQKIPYTLKVTRKFLSPEEYARATQKLSEKLSTRTIEIGFPVLRQEGRSFYVIGAVSRKQYAMRGIFSKRLVEHGRYMEFRSPVVVITPGKVSPLTISKLSHGPMIRIGGRVPFKPPVESEITKPIQRKYYEIKRLYGPYKPEPKLWIQKYRPPFWKDTSATQRLMPPMQIQKVSATQRLMPPMQIQKVSATQRLVSPTEVSRKVVGRSLKIGKLSQNIIPERIISYTPVVTTGYLGARLGMMKWAYEQRGIQLPEATEARATFRHPVYGGISKVAYKRATRLLQHQKITVDRAMAPAPISLLRTAKMSLSVSRPLVRPRKSIIKLPWAIYSYQDRAQMSGLGRIKKTSFSIREKKEKALKLVLADPFSVMESQIKHGKATHRIPTRSVWEEAEHAGWRLGTAEMKKTKTREAGF